MNREIENLSCRLIIGGLEWLPNHYESITIGDVNDDKVVNVVYDYASVSIGKDFLHRTITINGVLFGTQEYKQAHYYTITQGLIKDQYINILPSFIERTGFETYNGKLITFHRERFDADIYVKTLDPKQQGKVSFNIDVLDIIQKVN